MRKRTRKSRKVTHRRKAPGRAPNQRAPKPAKKAGKKRAGKPAGPAMSAPVRAGMKHIHALIAEQFYKQGGPASQWARGLGKAGEAEVALAESWMRARARK